MTQFSKTNKNKFTGFPSRPLSLVGHIEKGTSKQKLKGVVDSARAFVLASLIMGSPITVNAQDATDENYMLSIPSTDVEMALFSLARKTGKSLVIPSSGVSENHTIALDGTYTLSEALLQMLEGTNLSGDLTKSGVIIISRKKDADASHREEDIVVGKQIKNTLLAGASALVIGSVATPALAQTETPIAANAGAVVAVMDGSVTGHVTERRTGTDLPGVLVRIVETGETTQTDDLGHFRFPSVAPGNYTLQISYIGFPQHRAEFALGEDGQDLGEFPLGSADKRGSDEIIVFGSRSARQIALNIQRVASNSSDVVSADELGNFTGTTISDALRRVAAVSFIRDPANGDGTNIIVRGLEPDMNAVKLNGLLLPVGNGEDRSASLNNILVDSVDRITVHKTLLPSHDSAGTGGLVEIETKSPLSREKRYANFSLEGGKKGGDFGKDMLASGTVSGTFGASDNFGLSASVQYRERSDKTLGYSTGLRFGKYLPLESDGSLAIQNNSHIDPRLNFPYNGDDDTVYTGGVNSQLGNSSTETLGITLSAEWQMTESTNLKFDYVNSKSTRDSFNVNGSASMFPSYIQRPVAALGGEERYALTYDGFAYLFHSYDYVDGAEDTTDNFSFRGRTETGKWDVNYTLGYARGRSEGGLAGRIDPTFQSGFGNVLDNSYFLPEAIDPVEGLIISPFAPRTGSGYPSPLFTDAAWDLFNDVSNYNFSNGDYSENYGQNDRYTAELSTRYNFETPNLKYLEFGVRYEESKNVSRYKRFNFSAGQVQYLPPTFEPVFPDFSFAGFEFAETDLSRIGQSGRGFSFLTEDSISNFFSNLDQYTTGPNAPLTVTERTRHPRADDQFTKENNLSAWVQGRFDIGKLEIIGGLRLNQTQTHVVTISSPQVSPDFFTTVDFAAFDAVADQYEIDFSTVLDDTVKTTDILPRVLFNYRQSDNLIFRGGYFQTTARPSIRDLSAEEQLSIDFTPDYGPNNNAPALTILRGNPGLEPAITHNFDISAEYYSDTIGFMKLSGYYKDINNSLQSVDDTNVTDISGIEFPDHFFFNGSDASGPLGEFTGILEYIADPNTPVGVTFTRPENSSAPTTIWGVEAQFERQFTFLPGILDGFGVYSNIAYTDSKSQKIVTFSAPVLDANGNFIPVSYIQTEYTPATCDFANFVYEECYAEVEVFDGSIERSSERIIFSDVKFNFSPELSGTVALTYNKYNIDAALSYGFQSRYQSAFNTHNLDSYSEGVGTLDFRGSYYFDRGNAKFRVFIEGTDLLKGTDDVDLERTRGNANKYYTGATYLGGRKIRAGVSVTF